MKKQSILFATLIVFGIVAPWTGIYPVFLMKAWCFALFAVGFNLLIGFGGLTSFGHAAFFGGSAYLAGYAMKELGFPPLLGIAAGAACGAALGYAVGVLAVRRQGIYFSMVTLALAQMLYFVWLQAPFTHGEDGLQDIPRGQLVPGVSLQDNMTLYYVVFAVFMVGFVFIWRVVESPFGQALNAIRENEPRAISLGYDVARYKLGAFVISAALAGAAGATKSIVFQLASLTDVHWSMSGEIILMTLLGGVGTLLGPVVGAFLVVTLQNELATRVGPWVQVILGVIFMVCVFSFRQGIVGSLAALLGRRKA
ncbi:branched-chain amino acid ABC transporter permease [Variovorax sp. VNK109]|uniref:branched-chain amino acid ABC transporter permease n=1 Tax=Variovorax sp. VNK109 TaxID=3400919 RepID=UPI003C0C7482